MLVKVHYRAFGDVDDFEMTIGPDETHAMLEDVFAKLNRGSGQEAGELAERRSFSVGDQVTIYPDGVPETWECQSFGWKKLGSEVSR